VFYCSSYTTRSTFLF
nr:immunoglobulin light chain junction region [Macaca mulatta]